MMRLIFIFGFLLSLWLSLVEGSQNSTNAGQQDNSDAVTLLLIQLSKDMKSVKEDVSGVKQDVLDVKEDVSGVKLDVASLQQDMRYVKEDVNGFQDNMDALNAKAGVIQKLNLGLYTQVTDLQLKDQEIEKELADGVTKDGQQDDVISNLATVVSNNYEELSGELNDMQSVGHTVEGSIDPQCAILNQMDHKFYYTNNSRYDVSPSSMHSWNDARLYCMSRGGDLAFSEMHDMEVREAIFTGLGVTNDEFWYGLHFVDTAWMYVNGLVPSDEAIHWADNHPNVAYSCAMIDVYHGNSNNLLTYSYSCSYTGYQALCEYNCSE